MVLTCQKIVDLLVDYVDGDLGAATEQKLEEHLEHCPSCVKFIESYRRTGSVCAKALSIDMPQPVKSDLFEFLRSELQS